jgi:hypothetical protein
VDAITELIKLFQKQNDLVNSMATNSGDNSLASKNVNNDASNTPSNLTGNEKKRAKELSSIFVTSFFEEQRKREKDTKLGTKTSSPKSEKGLTSIAGAASSKQGEKAGGGLLDTLMSGLNWAWPLIVKLAGKIKEIFGKLGGAFKKLFSKIGSKIKGLFGKIKGTISKMWSKLKNSKIIKALKGYIDDAIKGIKSIFGKIKSKIGNFVKSIGKNISNMWGRLTSTNAYKSLSKAFTIAKGAITDFFKGIKDKMVNLASKATEKVKSLLPNSLKTVKDGMKSVAGKSKGFLSNVLSSGKTIVSKSVRLATKGAGLTAKGVKAVGTGVVKGTVAIGKGAASLTASAAKKTVSSAASGIIKSSGGMVKLMGRLTAKGAAKVPIIGPAIEAAFTAKDIKDMKEKLAKGEITEEQLQKDAGKRVITGVTGMLGGASGAVLAGALGSIIPVAGTALGAIAGGLLGDTAGRFLGGLVTDYVIPEKYTKTIGAFVTGTTPPKEEMQDFIIKDGKVHKFSKKDEVMGMKSGGAINDFLKSQHGTQSALYILYKINHMSAQYLGMIAQNTSIMAKGMKNMNNSSASPIVVNSPQPQQGSTKQMINIPDNRAAYTSSPYALG